MAAEDYYGDSEQHGNYQYVTLEQVINDFMMSKDDDDYTATASRTKVLYHARRGLREFYYDVLREIEGIELDLSSSLQVTLPPDFVNYVRISWVDDFGKLHKMAEDARISIAKEYLQDNDYSLLFDDDGCVMIGDGAIQDTDVSADVDGSYYGRDFCANDYRPNDDQSKVFANGRYKIDKGAGLIQFGSDAQGKSIVLEYISDGLFTGCEGRAEAEIRVHKFAEQAIIDYIYYSLIKQRRNVPANEKHRARKESWNARRIAKLRINALRTPELLQIFRGASKTIK